MNLFSEDQVIAAIIGVVVGSVIGYFMGGRTAPGNQRTRELEIQLQAAKTAHERFEQRVNVHFIDTASKLNALTDNYRDVYTHIANAAAELYSQDGGPDFSALATQRDTAAEAIEADSVMTEPPRDYAPKNSPDEPGVLNERFGLEGDNAPPEASDDKPGAQ